jgi:hypothetical protein
MAKGWPVGSIAKFNVAFDEPAYNERCSKKSGWRSNWEAWVPSQGKNITGGSFYMKITESGKLWLVGKILYTNGIAEVTHDDVRIKTKFASQPSTEYRILEKYQKEINETLGKSFYVDGTEDVLLTNDGETKKDVAESEYTVRSMNFKLTDLFDEPVFFAIPKGNNDVNKGFSVKMSSITTLQAELSKAQKEVIADWFGKQLGGATVVLEGERFAVQKYSITASSGPGFTSGFSAGPFITLKDAEDALDKIKEADFSFFPIGNLKAGIDTGYQANLYYNLEQMIDFAKANGVDVSMKKLLELKKGAVTGKQYGL